MTAFGAILKSDNFLKNNDLKPKIIRKLKLKHN
jgi:hypothetical protein